MPAIDPEPRQNGQAPPPAFPNYRVGGRQPLTLGGALVMVLLLFALIPAAQMLSFMQPPAEPFREIALAPPPPPPPLAENEPPPPPKPQRPTPPRIEPSLAPIATNSLQVELRPSVDDALLGAVDFGAFGVAVDLREEVERFTFDDLNHPPRPISVPDIEIPRGLLRGGFREGRVVLSVRIDTRGRVEVLDVVDSSHRDLELPARRAAARSLFEIPEVNGHPTEVYGLWPLTIRADRP